MCAPVRKDGTYGAFYVKPLNTFIKKQGLNNNNNVAVPIKKNLYQTMGYSEQE